MKKQICDPCADYIDEEYEKKQEKEDIQKLNNWTSQNKPSRCKMRIAQHEIYNYDFLLSWKK
jgi:hypothetical protein